MAGLILKNDKAACITECKKCSGYMLPLDDQDDDPKLWTWKCPYCMGEEKKLTKKIDFDKF